MTQRAILFASADEISEASTAFGQLGADINVVTATDGADCVRQYVALAHGGSPPLIVIVDSSLDKVRGTQVARSIRSMERGFSFSPSAIILRCTPEESQDVAQVIPDLGRAVQLTRKMDYSADQQLRRLVKASAKVLQQLKGRSRR